MFDGPSFGLGLALGLFLTLLLFIFVGIPNHKAVGFANGACTVACENLKASVENDKCYCEQTNGDKIYKETPRVEK